jgi:hypothetical protein
MSRKISVIVLAIIALGGLGYFASTRAFVRVYAAGRMVNKRTFDSETKLGATIRFGKISTGWIRSPFKVPMDNIWREKIGRKGMNYFLLGAPRSILKTYCARFDPKSKYYQAWFGCYTVLDEQDGGRFGFVNGQPAWDNFIRLAGEDQLAWLKTYRVDQPLTRIARLLGEPSIVEIHGQRAWRAFYEGDSQSDLNQDGSQNRTLNRFLGVPSRGSWEHLVTAHHELTLKGFFQVWREPAYSATFCCYGCGVSFRTLDRKTVQTFDQIKDEMLEMAGRVEIVPIPRSGSK